MRRNIRFNKFNRPTMILTIILFLSLFIIYCFSYSCFAQGEDIAIYVTNIEDQAISQIAEGETFKISVYDPDLETNQFLVNVEIEFNNTLYSITNETENSEITIEEAPQVDKDRTYIIKASKGSLTNETKITVKNTTASENKANLIIIPQDRIVDATQDFYVTITDDTSEKNPISGVTVYIENDYDQEDTTDSDGIAYLCAPKDKEQIKIYAVKEGYQTNSIKLRVNIPESLFNQIIESKYFVFSLAILILLSAVIFVHFRQKKSIYKRTNEITKERKMEKYGLNDSSNKNLENINHMKKSSSLDDVVRTNSKPESKIEEIRISKPRKEKEIVAIKTEEDKAEKVISEKKNKMHSYEWFEGKDDIKYEVDKLTGEVDEEGLDKWFEGVDDLKEKIKEKVKKDKKKDKKE